MKNLSRRDFLKSIGAASVGAAGSRYGLTGLLADEGRFLQPIVNLNVRTGPGTGYDKIGLITPDDIYQIQAEEAGWYQIDYNSQAGWVSGQYVTVTDGRPDTFTPGAGVPDHWDGSPLGRILLNYMTVYKEPSWQAAPAGVTYYYDQIIPIEYALVGEGLYHTNHTWLKVADGYIYSSWVQPVNNFPLNPAQGIGDGGAWAQVTVPLAWGKGSPSDEAYNNTRLYYSTVNRVVAQENGYYLVEEIYGQKYWVNAGHMRILSPDELSPINGHIPADQKHIYLSIRDQRIYCYEGETIVNQFTASTGMPSTPTTFGEYYVRDKRIGQRMTGGLGAGAYNLPGIPFVSYFTPTWAAIHGCYWHNDYGRLHSNGCVNLLPEHSKWIFRWTTPIANYWDFKTTASPENPGTRVVVGW